MICIQNVCGIAILVRLIPILVGVIYNGITCSKTPFTPINVVKEDLILSKVTKNFLNMA